MGLGHGYGYLNRIGGFDTIPFHLRYTRQLGNRSTRPKIHWLIRNSSKPQVLSLAPSNRGIENAIPGNLIRLDYALE